MWLPGTVPAFATLADATELDITGDIDIVAYISRDAWGTGADACIVNKETTTTSRSYRFSVNATGLLHLMLSHDGSVGGGSNIALSSEALPFVGSQVAWVRTTWRQSDGRVQFFTSTDGTNWTQLGTNQNINIPSIFSSDSALRIGGRLAGGSDIFSGRIYQVTVKNGIDGVVVANFTPETYLQNGWLLSAQNSAGAYPVIVENSRTPKYRAALGAASIADASEPKILSTAERSAAMFRGVDGQAYSIDKSSFQLNVNDDFDVQFTAASADWQTSTTINGICHMYDTSGAQRSWGIKFSAGGFRIYVSSDGSSNSSFVSNAISSVINPINNEYIEFKVSFRYHNSQLIVFYKCRAPGEAQWYDLGVTNTGLTSLYDANVKFQIGARYAAGGASREVFWGKLSRLTVTQQGATVASFDASSTSAWSNEGNVKVATTHNLPYAYFPGTADNYLTTGSHVNLSSGPVFLWGWYPGVAGSTVISQHNSVAGGRSVAMNGVNNAIRIFWSADGTNQTTVDSPTAPTWWTAAPGPGGYIGALINPAAESITFYDGGQDPTNNTNWTVLSSVTNITGLALYNNTDVPTFMGANTYGSYQIATGKIYRAGIGTSPSSLYDYARFDASTLQNWSVVQSSSGYRAAIITRSTVMFDGTDDYVMYPSRDGIQPQNTSVTYGVIAKIGVQQSGSYNRFFSMEEGNGNFKAIFSMYAEPPLAVYSQLDDGSGGVSSSIAKSNSEKKYVIAAKIDRQSNVQRLYVNGEESGTSSIGSYGSITVNNNLYFGRVSFSSGSYMQGYQMYGFFVARRSMTTAELNQVGQALLPEAYS